MARVKFSRGTRANINALNSGKKAEDGVFYVATDDGTMWLGKSDGSLLQMKDNINTTYSSLKNPYSLTLQGNGTTLTNGTYDGSAAKTVNITPASIGAATSGHNHDSVYVKKTGDTMTGTLTFKQGSNTGSGAVQYNSTDKCLDFVFA